jgi:hypothetical protein
MVILTFFEELQPTEQARERREIERYVPKDYLLTLQKPQLYKYNTNMLMCIN